MAIATVKSSVTNDYKALNVCIVGNAKVGKSTFASQLGDNVYFAATEAGHKFLSVYKSDIYKWDDFANLVTELTTTKHEFKTLVIDVVDYLVEMAEAEICIRNKVKAISDVPMGGGYSATRKLLMYEFTKLNAYGIGITFITHAKEKEYKSDSISWTAMGTSLSDTTEKKLLGFCDVILYAYVDKDKKHKVRTKPTKNIMCAGDRSGKLAEIMDLDAKQIMEALKK